MSSGRLQNVNNPYDIVYSDRMFHIGDGVLYKNKPMWVVSNTTLDLTIAKIAMIPKTRHANVIVYECTLPFSNNTTNAKLSVIIFDMKRVVCESSSFEYNLASKRSVATVALENLTSGTEHQFYYSIVENSDVIFRNIQLPKVKTPSLTLDFLTPGHTVAIDKAVSFSIRVNHTQLSKKCTQVSVSPTGELSDWSITPNGDTYVIHGTLTKLHHKSIISPVIRINDATFYDQRIRYKCLSCVEDIVMSHSVGFEEIHTQCKTVYTQPVTCFSQLVHNDVIIQNVRSDQSLDVTFRNVSPDTIYHVHSWVTDEFGQTSRVSIDTLHTQTYDIRNIQIQFTHRDTLVFGASMKRMKFTLNCAFKELDVVFISQKGDVIFEWKNVQFNKNDIFYEVTDERIRLTIDNVLFDEPGPMTLCVRGISPTGFVAELATNKVYCFNNDRTPPSGMVEMRMITCASTFASIVVTGYNDMKNLDFEYNFWITSCEARCGAQFDALSPVDVRTKPRIDFQDLVPDTPYAIVVKVETIATGSVALFRSLVFQTIPDSEFVMLHCVPTSTHVCSGIFESLNRKRVVVKLKTKQSYMVKRNSVIQLNYKNGGSTLLHTSTANHYLLVLCDGTHYNITKYTYHGFSYDNDIVQDQKTGSIHY
jgi:hypothetical protein